MNSKTYTNNNKIFIFVLILILLLNSVACLKRVSIPPESREIRSHMDTIYVHIKPGKEYMGKSILELEKPKVDGTFLIGMWQNKKIKIPLDDIDSIDVLQIDKKKVIIGSLIFVVISAISFLYVYGYASLLAED